MSAASIIRAFEILRGTDFTQQEFNCFADDYDGKYDRKTLDFAYKSLGVRPLAPKCSGFLSLFRKPLTSAHAVAGGSALGRAVGFSNSGGLGCNRFGLGDCGIGGHKGVIKKRRIRPVWLFGLPR